MKIRVSFDDFSENDYESLEAAKTAILKKFANGERSSINESLPDEVAEINEKDEKIKWYLCVWDVKLVEL